MLKGNDERHTVVHGTVKFLFGLYNVAGLVVDSL